MPGSSAPKSVALWRRLLRVARMTGHLVRGLAILATRYPRLSDTAKQLEVRRWARDVLRAIGASVQVSGGAPPSSPGTPPVRCLLVGNHVSWMDIIVLLSVCPVTFVAKSEIRRWPLVGRLCTSVGTLFIERSRRSAAKRVNAIVTDALTRGQLVFIFPEGTTTDGTGVAHFHSALFQSAADAAAMVQPVALRYTDNRGRYSAAPNFVGETTFLESLWSATAAPHIVARLAFLAPRDAAGRDRRLLAEEARHAIAEALGSEAAAGTAG
jgi:1-acyl-sn-glycerol-3-phosphate acyltransferase